MKRKFYNELLTWKNNDLHVPLMVVGARQVGKTFIIQEFCKKNFNNFYFLNLMSEKNIVDLFASRDSFEKKIEALEVMLGGSIRNSDDTVLFVDEVQESEEFIEFLKFFNESSDNFNIICAGSLLGVALKRLSSSFPVGKVIIKNMYPLDFEEFLWAVNSEKTIEIIKRSFQNNEPLNETLHIELMNLLNKFLYLGGMPAVINNYLKQNTNLALIDTSVIEQIMSGYFNDMSRYAEEKDSIRIRNLYINIPSQLAKENQKFVFTNIDSKDNRKRDYITPLDWLLASKLVFNCSLVTKPEFPLKGFVDNDSFKLYLSDTGILNNLLEITPDVYLLDMPFSYKGVVVENYVASELIKMGYELFYWSRKGKNNGNAEVDFIIQNKLNVIPIEVKSGKNTQAKSLKFYNELFKPKLSIRISANNFSLNGNVKDIPLYALFCLRDL